MLILAFLRVKLEHRLFWLLAKYTIICSRSDNISQLLITSMGKFMLSSKNPELRRTSDAAAFYALVCLIPIFTLVVTYGWGKILQPVLPIPNPYDLAIAYVAGLFLAVVGVVLAKVIAAERVQISLDDSVKSPVLKWLGRCWAYLFVLLVISALGTTRTIFSMSQASDVLSSELSATGTKLRNLQVVIDGMLLTPEYDARAAEYKSKRAKMEAALKQFESEMQRRRDLQQSQLSSQQANVESIWVQFEGEMKNPLNCGFGTESQKRFKELQAVLPGLVELSGSLGTQCAKIPEVLKQYREAVNSRKSSVLSLAKMSCSVTPAAAQHLQDLQALLPELKPLQATDIACDKLPESLKLYSADAKSMIATVDVPIAEVPVKIIEFKKKTAQDIQQQLIDIDRIVVESGKISPDEALPVLRKSWETYRKLLAEAESLSNGKKLDLPREIKREEVENIENLTNILRILLSRLDNFMTYFTVFSAILLDLILIAFFRRHLSSRVRAEVDSPYGDYVSGDNLFKS